jgi:hypothetical protein
MKYSGWQVNGEKFLLPASTRMEIRMANGVEFRNDSVYVGCHEFLGESTLRFGAPDERESGTPSKAAKALAAQAFPVGLRFTVQLAQDIAVATAAAGDPVKAVLATDLADGRKILAPKGTALACRIQRIRRHYYNVHDPGLFAGVFGPAASVEIVLRLESLGSASGPRPITAHIARTTPRPNRPGVLQQRGISLGPLSAQGANLWFARFEHASDDYVIASGTASDWVTAAR